MQNYFDSLPSSYRLKKNRIIPIIAIGISILGIISVVSTITSNLDFRKWAAPVNLGRIPQGCYYVRGDCTASNSPGATGSCKPILVCPTATPTIAPTLIPTTVPSLITSPTPSPQASASLKFKCIFTPSCLDVTPPCTDQKPVEGWCLIGAPNIIFQQ